MTTKLINSWSPRARLAVAISAALVIVLLLEIIPTLRSVILPLQQFTAMLAFVTIENAGFPIAIDGTILTHPDGFRVAISYGCTQVVPAIFLGSVLTLGLSLSWRNRLLAITSGLVLVTFLNLFRVAALYYIGVVSPAVFDLAHEWVGQVFIVTGTAIVACYWINNADKLKVDSNSVETL